MRQHLHQYPVPRSATPKFAKSDGLPCPNGQQGLSVWQKLRRHLVRPRPGTYWVGARQR